MNFKDEIERAKTAKLAESAMWALASRFLRSDQNLSLDDRGELRAVRRTTAGRNRYVANMLINIYRNIASRLAVSWPGAAVRPRTPSFDDIAKAKSSELLLRSLFDDTSLDSKYAEGTGHILQCGTVGFHATMDASSLDVAVQIVSAWDLFLDLEATSLAEIRWQAARTYISAEEAIRLFPDRKDDIEKATKGSRRSDRRSGGDIPTMAITSTQSDLLSYYEIYTHDNKYLTCIDGVEGYLIETEIPSWPVIPLQLWRFSIIPGEVWGLPLLTLLIDSQAYYNKTRNLILDNMELTSNPKYVAPKNSGVASSQLNGRPGEVVFYNAGSAPPAILSGAGLQPYVIDQVRMCISELYDQSGAHSTTLGKRPVGIDSGIAIQSITANDNTQLQMTADDGERCFKNISKVMLILAQRNWTEAKSRRLYDKYGRVIYKAIKNTDLTEDPEVVIDTGMMYQFQSKDREARTVDMLKLGLMTPDEARATMSMRAFGRRDMEELAGIEHAESLIKAISSGAFAVEIYSTDDLKSIEEVFKDYLRTDEYRASTSEIQNYLRDIYLSVVSYLMNPPPNTGNIYDALVFPKQQKPTDPNTEQVEQLVTPTSPISRNQVAGQQIANARKAQVAQQLARTGVAGANVDVSPEQQIEKPVESSSIPAGPSA